MCTTIRVPYPEGSVLARTMDYEDPVDYNILYYPKKSYYADDLMHNRLLTKYRMMGLCFYDFNPLKDGVNEYGLIGCTNLFLSMNPFATEVDPTKRNISSLDYMNYCLGNFRTVDEIIKDLEHTHISTHDVDGNKVICPEFHFMFVDRNNHFIVVQPKRKKMTWYEDDVNVCTNSPAFPTHLRRLKAFNEKILQENPAKNLPGSYDPVSRFIRAYHINHGHVKANNRMQAYEQAYSVMEAMKIPQGFIRNTTHPDDTYTRYICAYDTEKCELTVRSHTNPTVYRMNFDDFQHCTERTSVFLPKKIEFHSL